MSKQNNTETAGAGKHKKIWILGISILLLILLPLTVLAVYVNGYEGIFPNIYVGDVSLAGKTADEAFALLNKTYRPEAIENQILVLKCQDAVQELPATDLGVVYKNRETVGEALALSDTRHLIPAVVRFLKQLVTPTHLAPSISYQEQVFSDILNTLAAPYEVEPINFTFEIDKEQVTLHAPVDGVKVDRTKAVAELEEGIRSRSLSVMTLTPLVTPVEELDFDSFYDWLTSPAEDAYYTKDEVGIVRVTREKLQCNTDKQVVRDAIRSIRESGNPTATFPVTTTEPAVLSLTLEENLYKDTLGSYTTRYSGSYARNNNVQLATSRVDGYELMPGEEFSYDQTILPRTSANGYMAAPVYVGNKVESGMGGGICQPSSTLYCAALYANLEITERHNHSMLVSYLPAGLDATIAQGVLDLKFKNNTPYPVKIAAQASGGVLTFNILGYNPENISVEIIRGGGGLHYTATRIVKKDGVEIHREALSESRYVPEEPKETPQPSPSPSPAPSASPAPAVPQVTPAPVPAVTPPPAPVVTPAPAVTQAPPPAEVPAGTEPPPAETPALVG